MENVCSKVSFKIYLMFFLGILSLVGCLKDKKFDSGQIQSVSSTNGVIPIISLGLAVNVVPSNPSVSQFLRIGVPNSNNDTIVSTIPVLYGPNSVAPMDIHVILGIKNALVDSFAVFNALNQQGDSLILPTNLISFSDSIVTIPKGSSIGYGSVKFNPSSIIGQDFGIGFYIKKVVESGFVISGNLNSAVLGVITKNPYDGLYKETGIFTRLGVARKVESTYKTKSLNTLNANTVETVFADFDSSTLIDITINADNTLTIVPVGSTPPLTPSGPNTYDPTTGTFTINQSYSSATRTDSETLVFIQQ